MTTASVLPSRFGELPAEAPAAPPDAAQVATASRSVLGLYRNVWFHAAGSRGRLVASTALLTLSQVVKLLVPFMAAQAINAIQKGGGSVGGAAWWVAGILGIYVLTWSLHGPGRVLERTVGVRVRKSMADALYTRLVRAPLAWHDKHHCGELQHRMGQATHALADFTQNQFIYLQNAVNLFGPLIALLLLSHLAGGLALLGYIGIGAVIIAFDRALMRVAVEENAAERRYASGLLDYLSNISTVMSLRLQASTRRLLGNRLDAVFAPLKRSIVMTEWKWCAVDLMTAALSWGLVAAYAWHSHSIGALLLGNLFMVYQYANQAGGVIGSLAANFQNFARVRTDFASAEPIWNAPQRQDLHIEEAAGPGADIVPALLGANRDWQRLDLRELSFRHAGGEHAPEAERGGLKRVKLSLHRGERVALVGPSGSGKSTLLRVLAGLYEPQSGHVEVDGVAPLGMRHIGRYATLIPQEAEVFEATVRENIAFDLPHSDEALLKAAQISSFDAVLSGMPQGLDTFISEGGSNLSGGQRQRLCLARGVLAAQDSSVLLLDEPTSALDPLTEGQVLHRLNKAFPDACLVASVHRMSLLSHFDRVVLMVAGEVVDSGTAEELLARQPLFREMVGGQAANDAPVAPAAAGPAAGQAA
ncbi:MAG: ABC transporter ATP-binding protein/permease [Aquabacterium sp.]|nr:ABC transporter ATP-binding protein/permease [Aquabacterium sp.]